jgi:phosphomannomutase
MWYAQGMECPRAAVFDLDDTLAESFEAPRPEMIGRLKRLLDAMPVAIITGRDFGRIEPGFLPELVAKSRTDRLFVFAESSTICCMWNSGAWTEIYGFELTPAERAAIREGLEASIVETHILDGLPRFGEQFVEKRAQTAFAMLGLGVPTDLKYSWDPGNEKRETLRQAVAEKLPDFEVLLGGATSIDVTKKGMNKSYGIRWLSERLDIPPSEMCYVGDALFEGGNDFVVIPTGIVTRSVSGPKETLHVIDELLAACST